MNLYERGVLPEHPDGLTQYEVLRAKGPYRVVWRSGPRVPESKRYAIHRSFGDPAVFVSVGNFHLEAHALVRLNSIRTD